MPPFIDDFTGTYARTTHGLHACNATEAVAITFHKKPRTTRFFYALIRWGWVVFPALVAVLVLTGCDDLSTAHAVVCDTADAQHSAKTEALAQRRP